MRVVIASEDRSTRKAIEILLNTQPDIESVETVADITDLLVSIKNSEPNLVVFDWDELGNNIGSLLELLELFERPPAIVALSVKAEVQRTAMESGITSFAYKGDPPDRLLETIRQTHQQQKSGKV